MDVILRQAVEKLGQPGDVVKVSPGFAVMRMRRESLTTVVPPVTELRMSVPGSFSTGADSPVMAASFT